MIKQPFKGNPHLLNYGNPIYRVTTSESLSSPMFSNPLNSWCRMRGAPGAVTKAEKPEKKAEAKAAPKAAAKAMEVVFFFTLW